MILYLLKTRTISFNSECVKHSSQIFIYLADHKIKDLTLFGDYNFPSITWLDETGFSGISSEIQFIDRITEADLFQHGSVETRCRNTINCWQRTTY